jgi:Na+-transporting methylmalonyl-CoA/oxaloacetate decarboxylase gamma subunit
LLRRSVQQAVRPAGVVFLLIILLVLATRLIGCGRESVLGEGSPAAGSWLIVDLDEQNAFARSP